MQISLSDILMMQLEIDPAVVEYAKDLAVSMGKMVILDPAPAKGNLPDSIWKGVEYIKPNETELEILVGRSLNGEEERREAAEQLRAKGVKNVMVSLGGDGLLLVNDEGCRFFPANKVNAVDTTAAGDCFTASFALALSKGEPVDAAIRFADFIDSYFGTDEGSGAAEYGERCFGTFIWSYLHAGRLCRYGGTDRTGKGGG